GVTTPWGTSVRGGSGVRTVSSGGGPAVPVPSGVYWIGRSTGSSAGDGAAEGAERWAVIGGGVVSVATRRRVWPPSFAGSASTPASNTTSATTSSRSVRARPGNVVDPSRSPDVSAGRP